MKKITHKVTDKNGIHARPAGLLVKTAEGFRSAITVTCGDRTSDCKKLLRLMAMGIKYGEEIEITAEGEDEEEAIAAVEKTIRETGL